MKRIFVICLFVLFKNYGCTYSEFDGYTATKKRTIVALICSRNNVDFVEKNLGSIVAQDYPNYKIVYVDDNSSDGTAEKVQEFAIKNNILDKIVLIRNQERKFKPYNIYWAINEFIDGEDIVFEIDGDDWLTDLNVFTFVNNVFDKYDVWMAFGSLETYSNDPDFVSRKNLFGHPFPDDVIRSNSFRSHGWVLRSPRMFYSWLFKKIEKKDFMWDENHFFEAVSDGLMMIPMLEMAGYRHINILECLYVYNHSGTDHDHIHSLDTQNKILEELYKRPTYKLL